MVTPERHILNSREAADYLGISLNTLYRIEKQGDLNPFRTPGGHRRYDLKMLDEYLESTRDLSDSRLFGGQQQ
jgi:excisionase family DNA binding protein